MAKQPQDKGLSSSLLDDKARYDQKFLERQKDLPREIISTAEKQQAGFNELKSAIDGKMLGVHQTLEEVRQMIRDNIKSPQHLEGLLTRREAHYLGCLELNHRELENLFREDQAQWAENVEIAKRNSEQINQKLVAFIEKQRQDL